MFFQTRHYPVISSRINHVSPISGWYTYEQCIPTSKCARLIVLAYFCRCQGSHVGNCSGSPMSRIEQALTFLEKNLTIYLIDIDLAIISSVKTIHKREKETKSCMNSFTNEKKRRKVVFKCQNNSLENALKSVFLFLF